MEIMPTEQTMPSIATPCCRIEVGEGQTLWYYVAADGRRHPVAAPLLQLDGVDRRCSWQQVAVLGTARVLANGCTEHVWAGPVAGLPELELRLVLRLAEDSPVVRFRYEWRSSGSHRLTRPEGRDRLELLGLDLQGLVDVCELRFSEFNEQVHSYLLTEDPIPARELDAGTQRMGPILLAGDDHHQLLVAYEHGSTHPDRFLEYTCAGDRQVQLRAVKGSHWHGQPLDADHPYLSPWCQLAAQAGDRATLASAYRHFVLERQAEHPASRQPWIFYNTWNHQERRKHWQKQPYLSEMHLERMLAEIEVAARMGIEVFVIDTGWYEKTGDWLPSSERFPDGLKEVRARLEGHGMRLGLWFAPGTCALSSRALAEHRDCIRHQGDGEPGTWAVWETEASQGCCLVSRYGAAFADELIRIHHELGVSYFKWDAIGQYGCDRPGHGHGETSATARERADCYAYQQPMALAGIVERIQAAVPDAICDFDVTESGRSVGLAFLSASKYFLINNGPYFHNYDNPKGADGNPNLFFFPGPARPWICRSALDFDRWIPSILFLTHYLPDDGKDHQLIGIGSLILGHNGIWGDLCAISDDGVARFGELLTRYKQVRQAITRADPVRRGRIGGDPEIHEKLDATGRGAVVLFASHAGRYRHITSRPVDPDFTATEDLTVELDADGHAVLTAHFAEPSARIVFFGRD
jgi:alpha-galactosidase